MGGTWLLTLEASMPAERAGQTLRLDHSRAAHSTYHDDGDPGRGAVLFGERIIKVLF